MFCRFTILLILESQGKLCFRPVSYTHLRPGLGPGLSPATVRGIHAALHQALQAAADQGLMPNNPAKHVEPPKVPRNAMNILTEEQLEVFLAADDKDPIWRDFFYTELTTGCLLYTSRCV